MRWGAGLASVERRVRASWIIRTAVLSTATASITATRNQNSQTGQRWCSTICQVSPRGQQESTGSNGEPSGGLIAEAGQLLALSLVQLRERGLPEQPGPAAAQHVHNRRH